MTRSITFAMGLVVLGEDTIKSVLRNAGLTDSEAVIYIFLARHEPLKGTEIAKLSKRDKAQVFRILKRLQAKGFVEATLEFPTRYTTVSFEKILESVVEAKREEVDLIERAKDDLLDKLRKRSLVEPSLEKFVVIKGKKRIYSKISEMVHDNNNQISIALTVSSLRTADRYGVFNGLNRSQLNFRLLTDLSKKDVGFVKPFLKKTSGYGFIFRARNSDLDSGVFPRLIIKDNQEMLFFTSSSNMEHSKREEVSLWTNCVSLVKAFSVIFEEMWRSSLDIQNRLSEIETGKISPSIRVIPDLREARRTYEEALQASKKEIVLITSSQNLVGYCKNLCLFEEWSNKGVSVRIMAPIVNENLEVAMRISRVFPVRHVASGYPEATMIDRSQYFQFKGSSMERNGNLLDPNFENVFYTNDVEYIDKIGNMFDNLWQNACAPSSVTLERLLEPVSLSERKPAYLNKVTGLNFKDSYERVSEKAIVDKIFANMKKFSHEKKDSGVMTLHGSAANAVIHPPDHFGLPDLVIFAIHAEKHSLLGEDDAMLIYLWLDNPGGSSFVPVAYVGDNPKAEPIWKAFLAGTPAGNNVQIIRKDELEIQIHGNSLFAGWTKPITLYPLSCVLPPSCLLVEGYGEMKAESLTVSSPSGYRTKIERNGFEAFVTFFHPASKYSGPGTDGLFSRDYIATTYPPDSE